MADLRLRASGAYGTSDLVARFDDHTTVGQLADEIEPRVDRPGDVPRTIQRQSRGTAYFSRDERLIRVDLRNGDAICLGLDTGLRATSGAATAATLRVVEGVDAGRSFELQRGESVVGRSTQCDITLADEMASRRHVVFRVSDIVEIADAGSTNGVMVNGEPIAGVRRVRPGDRVLVGDTVLTVDLLGGDHEAVDIVDNRVEFNRPPRIEQPFQPVKVQLPTPVDPLKKPTLPLIAAAVPLLMGGMLYYFTRNVMSIAFIAMSPLMLFGNFWQTKRTGKREHAERRAEYEATLDDKVTELEEARDSEIRSRFRFSPDSTELIAAISDLTPRLWERSPADQDFLSFRVGLVAQPSLITVEVGSGGKRDQRKEQEQLAQSYETLPPVPLTFDGRWASPIGLAGPHEQSMGVARSLVLQASALHSPDELVIGGLFSTELAAEWEFVKWLPHADPARSPLPGVMSAVGPDRGIELLAQLQDLINERRGDDDTRLGADRRVFVPHVLILVDGSVGIERSRFSRLLDCSPDAGVTVLWLDADSRRLPNDCKSVVIVEPGGSTLSLADAGSGEQHGGISLEAVELDAAELAARATSPIIDISAAAGGSAALPRTASLIDLLGGYEMVESPSGIAERWAQAAPTQRLLAPVGAYEGGALSIDLRVDGPHGLVGGTTGAGKSEFLQSFITSLAASHGPDRINFLLVDYKGGSAFGDLVDQFSDDGTLEWSGLRHTVGMITDLTPALVQRALVSLQAELHRRELILNQHRAKDLAEMEKQGYPDTPPSLLIVVDEFAALAKEVPAFVEGVVDIAQRGRSLGLHLLLATQKPGGVVTANIQANTNLRVALRMASEDESNDVVRSPIAGRIDRSTPGRGVMRRGPEDLVPFQSAYVGGVTTPATSSTLEVGEFSVQGINWFSAPTDAAAPLDQEIDLKRLVRVINAAADQEGFGAPRRPWLDPLPSVVSLYDLPRAITDQAIPIGLLDEPARQGRSVAYFEPDEAGSLLVYGMGGSGKTVVLRTMATSFGLTKQRSVAHVYGLDFAGRGLEMITSLPHVGDVVPGDDYERVTRLLRDLQGEVARRSEMFALARAATLGEFRAAPNGDPNLPRLVVLLDGFDNFLASYERIDRGAWADLLPRLVGDGRGVGIHFILTGSRRSSFPMALAAQISNRLVLRMASEDDYHSVGADPKRFDPKMPPGQGALGDLDVQIALVGSEPATAAEAEEYRRLGAALASRTAAAPEVRVLPSEIAQSDLPRSSYGARWLLTDEFTAIGPDLSQNVLIAGRPRSGKTTALKSLLAALAEQGLKPEVFAFAPERFGTDARSFDDLEAWLASNPEAIVAIEEMERLSGHPAEFALQQAIQAGKLKVIGTADSGAARAYDPTLRAVRARCDVVVLQPDVDTDGDLLGNPIPRTARSFPPGRGYANLMGRSIVVQTSGSVT